MLIRKKSIDKDCVMGIWKITETRDELLNMLSSTNQEKAHHYLSNIKSNRRTLEWLSSRLLLQLLTNDDKTIEHTDQGQPFLVDNSFQISISHSKDYAVVLLHKYKKVGVDIENYSQRILKVEKRFISETEYIDPNQRTLHLILHWCAKETLYKLMNSTEIVFKKHLHIEPFQIQEEGIMNAYETFTENKSSYSINYEVKDDFVLAWGSM